MKTIRNFGFFVIALLLSSCAVSVKFPVPGVVPAAEISATKKPDKQKNYVIELTALKYL